MKAPISSGFLKNFSALSLVQVVNMILPLIMYPFFISEIGKEVFGFLIFNQSIVLFVIVFLSFGLNLYAVKEANDERGIQKISTLYFGIVKFKTIVLTLSVLIIYFCTLVFEKLNFGVILMYSGAMFYEVLVPVWLFQIHSNLYLLALYSLISKSIFVVLCLLLIEGPKDYLVVPAVDFLSQLVLILLLLRHVFYGKRYVNTKFIGQGSLVRIFWGGYYFFLGNITREIFVRSPPIIIGTLVGFSSVIYYDFAAKVLSAYKTFISIVSQILYSRSVVERNKKYIVKMFVLMQVFIGLVFLVQVIISEYLIDFFLKTTDEYVLNVLTLITFSAFFISANNILSIHVLIPSGRNKTYAKVQMSSLFIYLTTIFVFYINGLISLLSISSVLLAIEAYLFFMFLFITLPILRNYNDE